MLSYIIDVNISLLGGPIVKRKNKTAAKTSNNHSAGKRNYKDKKFGFGGKKKGNKMNNT